MTIRKNLLIAISVSLLGVLAVVYASARLILLDSFARLEEREVRADVQRALGQLAEDQAKLRTTAVDYASWDDTYAFVAGEMSSYPEVNLNDQTYQNLQLNLVLIVDTDGQIIYGSGYDLEAGKMTPVPAGLLAHITLSDRLLDHSAIDSSVAGVVLLPEGPMVVASRPILTSDYQGPIGGTLIFGHYLSTSEIDRLAKIANLSLAFRHFDDPQLPADFEAARANLSPALPTFVRPLDANTVAGYSLVMDLYGQPALLLQVETARDLYAQGQASLNYFLGWLVVMGLMFSAGIYMAVDRLILSRQAQRASEAKYRTLVEQAPAVTYIIMFDERNSLQYISPQIETILGFSPGEWLGDAKLWIKQLHPEDRERARRERIHTFATGEPFLSEYRLLARDGRTVWVRDDAVVLKDETGKPQTLQGVVLDITGRKQAEVALRESEVKYRTLVDEVSDGFYVSDLTGTLTFANRALAHILGVERPEALVGRSFLEFVPPAKVGELAERYQAAMAAGKGSQAIETEVVRQDGARAFIEIRHQVIVEAGRPVGNRGTLRDVTERKQAEDEIRQRLAELEAVNQLSTAMRGAHTQDEMLSVVLDVTLGVLQAAQGAVWLHDPVKDELRTVIMRGWGEQTDVSRIPPEKPGVGVAGIVFASGQPYVASDFHLDLRLPESVRQWIPPGMGGAAIPIRAADKVIGVFIANAMLPRELTPSEVHLLTILSEIAGNAIQRTRLHEQTEQRLQRLDGLHQIDTVINASLDLHLTLNVFVDQVITQLRVDAAAVILLNRQTQMLEYTAGRGFRSPAIAQTRQRLGEGNTGRAALERHTIHIPNLREAGKMLRRTALLTDDGFVAYYGVPLIAKGQVKGVLEVFHRAPIEPDEEWLDFLNALAGQAAIAVDNATLFNDLQRSNSDLTTAYDATIEGWSRALDLRDEETEGHTLRVTDVTMQLARNFGLGEAQLAQVRWGALLHDIGKMGVADRILLKPGPLTEEEWAVMKRHPVLAYEMLSPIRYLRSALDIPYSHHEKWDGTGYPQGLKGEGIPLTARIFAVVDVWDALRSDRPYRPAWPEEKVIEHIRSLAGTHFDPQVVKVCLESGLLASGEGQ